MIIAVAMLIYTARFELQLPACVIIHVQCLNIKLISPVYFSNGAVCPKLSDQQVEIGINENASFEIYTVQDEFEGALLFQLQFYPTSWFVQPRECIYHRMGLRGNFGCQCGFVTTCTKVDEDETKYVQLLVAWRVKYSKPFSYVALIEHTEEFTWDEDKLKGLYDKNYGWLKKYDDTQSDIWFIDDNMSLRTLSRVESLEGNFELNVVISDEERDDYAMSPICFDYTR
jgi:hypothetical protein